MERDARPGELYDFLYRDTGRLTSYYSQIFEGHLTSLEHTDSDSDTFTKKAVGNIEILKGELDKAEQVSSTSKRTIDPHDLITTDVLTSLREGEFIRSDISDAPHGSLVQARGTVVFADRHMLEMASVVFDSLISAEKQKPRHQQNKATLAGYALIDSFIKKMPMPSAFFLQTPDGIQMAGTIKDAGMEEPISTYYFRHGTSGLSDIYLIGIKEVPTTAFTLPGTQMLAAAQQAAEALSQFLFPPEAIRITPLALFRKFRAAGTEA